jgi:hypothetical protein
MRPYSETAWRVVNGQKQKVKVWRVDIALKPKRRRKTFASKAKAETFIAVNAGLKRQHGEIAYLEFQSLAARERSDVLNALNLLNTKLAPSVRHKFTLSP